MATTIQVSDNTKQLLEILKKKEHAANYDQVINMLLQKKSKVPTSLFGSFKGMKWEKKDRMDFHEL